jgi:hypothetical protein
MLYVLYLLHGTVATGTYSLHKNVASSGWQMKMKLLHSPIGTMMAWKSQTHGNTWEWMDQKQRRLVKTIEMKTTLLFYGLVARDDENPMVACQNRVLV